MIAFSKEQQQRAVDFIEESARPLEKQLYMHYFADEAVSDTLTELAPYQNPDGGFGCGIEPDLRAPCSSALATSNALAILRELAIPATNALPQGAVSYLLNTFDTDTGVWQVVPPEVNDAPHAPWMGYDDKLSERWHGFLANPRATIVASLLHYSSLVPSDYINGLLDSISTHLDGYGDTVDMHEFHCYADLMQVAALPSQLHDKIDKVLRSALGRLVQKDSEGWETYNLRPLDIVSSPDSPFANMFADEIEKNLDYLIQGQLEDGAWPITWSWGDTYPDVWPVAEKEWKGILIVSNMKKLRAFERIS